MELFLVTVLISKILLFLLDSLSKKKSLDEEIIQSQFHSLR